jgi:hypothetical protein
MIGTHQALARRAVGRGIRHGFGAPSQPQPATAKLPPVTSTADSLSELANNYQNSLKDDTGISALESDADPTPLSQMQGRGGYYDSAGAFSFFLSRNSSLVDLAMIAPVDDALEEPSTVTTDEARDFTFVDFPNPEVHPGASTKSGDEGMQE